MAKFVGDPIIFENKTDLSFEVSTGIVFRKSGIYEVSIAGNRTIVSKVSERKKGKWIFIHPLQENDEGDYMCSECKVGGLVWKKTDFCPNCGADMRGEG